MQLNEGIKMYTVNNNTAYINGVNGKYDNIVNNPSVRYGRNAVNNHIDYLKKYTFEPIECDRFEITTPPKIKNHKIMDYSEYEKFIKGVEENLTKVQNFIDKISKNANKMPPINFKLQYMPNSIPAQVDSSALMGASYEEMGQKFFEYVDEMNKKLNPNNEENGISADAMDLNHDNKIDIGEYAASILLSDALSTDSEDLNIKNINGIITNKGENKLLAYGMPQNKDIAYKTYLSLYQTYNLDNAAMNFISDSNNFVNLD